MFIDYYNRIPLLNRKYPTCSCIPVPIHLLPIVFNKYYICSFIYLVRVKNECDFCGDLVSCEFLLHVAFLIFVQ
jgi:hypothetical protein